jgi:2-iminobutanoate/2-iminopropanoate deaminase
MIPRVHQADSNLREERYSMQQRTINPWKWQDQLGFVQAIEVSGAQSVLYCAGQTSMDAQGRPANKGDMRGQITLAMDNLEEVLRHAGTTLSNVVRLNYYTTDVDRFFAAHDIVITRLKEAGCQPASTLLGVHGWPFLN